MANSIAVETSPYEGPMDEVFAKKTSLCNVHVNNGGHDERHTYRSETRGRHPSGL